MTVALDRAQAVRRHLRQHRLHADQDAGRQRLRRAPRPARRRLRRRRRRRRQRRHGSASRRAPTRSSADARSGVESWLRGMTGCTVIEGHARFDGADTRARRRRAARPRRASSSTSAAAQRVPDMPGIARRAVPHQHVDARARSAARASASSSAAATSGSSSRRCTAASAPR